MILAILRESFDEPLPPPRSDIRDFGVGFQPVDDLTDCLHSLVHFEILNRDAMYIVVQHPDWGLARDFLRFDKVTTEPLYQSHKILVCGFGHLRSQIDRGETAFAGSKGCASCFVGE